MKKLLLVLSMALLSVSLVGCANPFLPVYDLTKDDGYSVMIDGVTYKQLPALKWQIDPSIRGKVIGYGSDGSSVIWLEETDGNFIYLKGKLADYYDTLYRADKDIPEPSASSVDMIVWEDYRVEDSEIKDEYNNTVEDKDIITELFNLFESGDQTDNCDGIKNESALIQMFIRLYCSDLPGVYYELDLGLDNGRLVCGRPMNGYVYIPNDLLEKLAGKKIDTKKLLG